MKIVLTFGFCIFLISCKDAQAPTVHPPELEITKEVPAWVGKYKLLLPGAIVYKSGDRFVLKTIQTKEAIKTFYKSRFDSLGFKQTIDLNQGEDILMHFEKGSETIAVEIDKLLYSSNHLIRLGQSIVDYNRTVPK